MVNGPPTPPATTPAELQDEARTAQLQANPAPVQNILPSTVNHPDFVRSANAYVSRGDFQGFAREASRLNDNLPNDGSQFLLVVQSTLVLSYLILDDLPPARHTLLRLPDHLAAVPLAKGLLSLVNSTMNRDHTAIYSTTAALIQSINQDTQDKDFSLLLSSLLTIFQESFRSRTFALLSKAYTSLHLRLATTYLGLTADQVLLGAERDGWSYDAASQILYPKPLAKDETSFKSGSKVSNLSTFDFVADSVARLEM